ncbi:MAG: DegT/DnrJ/EryC1/StrS family aminotransferase, partial [Candidatus Kerfeldbacteria bacterium CG08_land_8_20_14_0_20_40_16]
KGNYFEETKGIDYVSLGYNLRMPTMLAVLGASQLKRVNWIIKKRREKAKYLIRELAEIDKIATFQEPKDSFAVYQMYTIR